MRTASAVGGNRQLRRAVDPTRPPSAVQPARPSALARVAPYLAPLLCSLVIFAWGIRAVLASAGEPALPLDDSFIHLQYARRLAEGHWYSYAPGDGYTPGATSALWPLLIAPLFLLGLDDLQVIWGVWLLGAVVHAAIAVETARLVTPLTSRGAGVAAGAMCLTFGAFAWFGLSGMETLLLAWALMRGARVASAVCEANPAATAAQWRGLWITAWIAALARPEGAIVALIAVMAGLGAARDTALATSLRVRALVVPLFAPLAQPAMNYLLAGQTASTTAQVKWLALDPYLDRSEVVASTLEHVALLVSDLLNGGLWTWLFVPEWFVWPLFFGAIALWWLGLRRRLPWRAWFVTLVLLGTFIPCSYSTMLWNRVRYIWPFAGAWFVVVTCLAAAIGEGLGRIRPRAAVVGAFLMGAMIALLAIKLPWVVADVAQSARAIALQQATLGRWARQALPEDAVIGVNDTGAIAYLSRRRTFDVVGLTTRGEARYWVAGAGSRYEHYETMPRAALPTHYLVYEQWMAMPAVLGEWLTEATVVDQSILGGHTMTAYSADYGLFGSGALPFTPGVQGRLVAELDVSELASEERFYYQLHDARAHYNIALVGDAPDGHRVADGGRTQRYEDRFYVTLGEPTLMVMRVEAQSPLEIYVAGERLGEAEVRASTSLWDERVIELEATEELSEIVVRPTERVRFGSYHYWWFAR
jgi:hypothetical protein